MTPTGAVPSRSVLSGEMLPGEAERRQELGLWLQEMVIERGGIGPAALTEAVRRYDPLLDTATVAALVNRVVQRGAGLAAIEPFLTDPSITEIMVNGPGAVWVDRAGHLEPSQVVLDLHDVGLLIERILEPLGLRVDRTSPLVDARLPDGSRVNIIVPPLAIDGPVVTIRRFATGMLGLHHFGGDQATSLLAGLVLDRATILVAGPTGAGKTTLLNALGALLDPSERIVVIEDTAELQLPGRHVVRLETRPANSEGVGAVDLRALVRNALRMRPDRLVIGEVRGPEALDLVLALNTGHRGSLATCHASGPRGALQRLEALALLGGSNLPAAVIRSQLASAIDVVVTVARQGSLRRIVDVTAVVDGQSCTMAANPGTARHREPDAAAFPAGGAPRAGDGAWPGLRRLWP